MLYLMLTGELLVGGRQSRNVSPSAGLALRNEAMDRVCSAEFISARVRYARDGLKHRAAKPGGVIDDATDLQWAMMGLDLVEAMLEQDPTKRVRRPYSQRSLVALYPSRSST